MAPEGAGRFPVGGGVPIKNRLRAEMRRRLAVVDSATSRDAGRAVARCLIEWPPFEGARAIAVFASLPGELDTRPIVEVVRAADKHLLFPRIRSDQGGLDFVAVDGFEELRPGRYGVAEPPSGRPAADWAPGDLVLVPGLAFDTRGGRLGRGGGHYDRALGGVELRDSPVRVGVGFGLQRVDAVPVEAHDVRMHAVAAEDGILEVRPARS